MKFASILQNLYEANNLASESQEDDFPSIDQIDQCIRISSSIMFILYGVLLFAATYNTISFIFGSSRYQNFHITYFYVLVYLVVFLRLSWISLILYVINNSDDYLYEGEDGKQHLDEGPMKKAIYQFDLVATYLELLIGI